MRALLLILGIALLCGGYAGASRTLAATSPATAFADPAGDSGNAPDLTAVAVTNDDRGITFTIAFPNRAALGSQDLLLIELDTDRNPATGAGGFDYRLRADSSAIALQFWNGSSYTELCGCSVVPEYANGMLTVQLNRDVLGATTGFNFRILSYGDGGNTAGDTAPDTGTWTYQLATSGTTTTSTTSPRQPRPKLVGGAVTKTPESPHAGARLTVAIALTDANTGAKVTSGAVSCSARIGSARLVAHGRFSAKGASCALVVPADAKGKKLTITVTVHAHGAILTRTFALGIH